MTTNTAARPSYVFQSAKWRKEAQLAKAALQRLSLSRIKTANIGGDQEQPFEQAFASLAFTFISDKAPRLLDYMIGFQLVDRNDDNTKAVGVFGFHIGEQWVYAPVFFINGDLKGHELLYQKEQDSFVPMKENWINYILSRKPYVLGRGQPETLRQLGVLEPNLQSMAISPRHGKFASGKMPGKFPVLGREHKQAALRTVAKLATEQIKGNPRYEGLDRRLSLDTFLSHGLDQVKAAMALVDRYPELQAGIDRFYGPDVFRNALLSLREQAVKTAARSDFLDGPQGSEKIAILPQVDDQPNQAPNPHPTLKEQPLKINVMEDVLPALPQDTQDADRQKLLRDGYLIDDRREANQISLAYTLEGPLSLVSPNQTGLYDVLLKPGKFEQMLVIVGPLAQHGHREMCTVVHKDEPRNWLNTNSGAIYTRNVAEREEYEKWLDSLPAADSVSVGSTYVILGDLGQGTCPFRVLEDEGDGCYRVHFHAHSDNRRPGHLPPWPRNTAYAPLSYDYDDGEQRIYLKSREGRRFRDLNGILYLPVSAKLLKLQDPADQDSPDDTPHFDDQSAKRPIMPGNLEELQMSILQKTAELKVAHFSTEVLIKGREGEQRLTPKAALFSLVRDHGFREQTAKEILKQAELKRSVKYRVLYGEKLAAPMMAGQDPISPAMPFPNYYMENLPSGGYPAHHQMEQFLPVPALSSAQTDPAIYDYWNIPDPMALQTAQQSAQSGQKEVFDTSILGGLLKAVRQDSIVDRYVGDLMKALDRLGRILFLFYWHSEEFQDRFGKSEMPELEDTLRNSFESLGDLVLFLLRKTIEPFPGQGRGDPNIDEAARN